MQGGVRVARGRRGSSEVLGAILVFAILVAALSLFQVTVVPQSNKEVEIKHSAQVRGDMQDVRSSIVHTGFAGERTSATVTTGAAYPVRSLAVNPADARGRLRTSDVVADAVTVDLSGSTAVNPESGDYWNGSVRAFDGRFLVYRPAYNYYDGAPSVVYEPTVLYSSFPDGPDIVEGSQSLVEGSTVNLALLSGRYDEGGAKATVETRPVSAPARGVEVTGPITLTVKTRLSAEAWEDLEGQPGVSSVTHDSTADPNEVEIRLADRRWTLNLAEVSVAEPTEPGPAYIEVVGDRTPEVNAGESVDLTVRVLDRYGNPVEGESVTFEDGTTRKTDGDGTATLEYVVGHSNTTVNAWFGGGSLPGDDAKKVTFDMAVDSGLAMQVNPNRGFVYDPPAIEVSNEQVDVTFRSVNTTNTVTGIRVSYYHANRQGNSGTDFPERWRLKRGSRTKVPIGGDWISVDATVPDGDTETFQFEFESDESGFEVQQSDYFIVAVKFSNGDSRLYFVSPD